MTAADGAVILPFERDRLVGQSIMVSPTRRHVFWKRLIDWLVDTYDPHCYEPTNTGPDAVTTFWNKFCGEFNASGTPSYVKIAYGFSARLRTDHVSNGRDHQ